VFLSIAVIGLIPILVLLVMRPPVPAAAAPLGVKV